MSSINVDTKVFTFLYNRKVILTFLDIVYLSFNFIKNYLKYIDKHMFIPYTYIAGVI
mgnify:CR=1 FL=1